MYKKYEFKDISVLKGKTIKKINVLKRNEDIDCDDCIEFIDDEGYKYIMFHYQDCCESVSLEDIMGDLANLLDSEIIMAEEVTSQEPKMNCESYTWTFYKFATAKGYVTLRWFGESNGYYSEEVDFVVSKKPICKILELEKKQEYKKVDIYDLYKKQIEKFELNGKNLIIHTEEEIYAIIPNSDKFKINNYELKLEEYSNISAINLLYYKSHVDIYDYDVIELEFAFENKKSNNVFILWVINCNENNNNGIEIFKL